MVIFEWQVNVRYQLARATRSSPRLPFNFAAIAPKLPTRFYYTLYTPALGSFRLDITLVSKLEGWQRWRYIVLFWCANEERIFQNSENKNLLDNIINDLLDYLFASFSRNFIYDPAFEKALDFFDKNDLISSWSVTKFSKSILIYTLDNFSWTCTWRFFPFFGAHSFSWTSLSDQLLKWSYILRYTCMFVYEKLLFHQSSIFHRIY